MITIPNFTRNDINDFKKTSCENYKSCMSSDLL